MKFCAIAPILHLNQTKENAIHMALTHLCDNEKYVSFMQQEHENGKMIILDNSLIELGRAVSVAELLEAANKISADEIIVPDSYKNAKETVELATKYIPKLRQQYSGRIMAVAHGKTIDEWAWCAKKLIELGIDTIGIPKVMCETIDNNGRKLCIRKLKRMFTANEIARLPEIHLLGIWSDPLEVASIETCADLDVRSVDSVIAWKYASYGMRFADGPRPAGAVDFINGRCDNLVHLENIIELRQLTHDDMRLLPMAERIPTNIKKVICTPVSDGNLTHVDFSEK